MTYADLKSDVADYLARSDLTTQIPLFIKLAESRIRDMVRVRDMETTDDAFTVDAQVMVLPTGFLSMRRVIMDSTTSRELTYLPPERFWDSVVSWESGNPEAFTIEGSNIVFGPSPSTSLTAKMLYTAAYAALSAETDTNWLLANAYDVYLYGALAEAKGFIEDDEQANKWLSQFHESVSRVNKSAVRGRIAGPLQRFGHSAP